MHSLEIGDILVETWGYEQTNVDFWQVVKRTNKSVWVKYLLHGESPAEDRVIPSDKFAWPTLPWLTERCGKPDITGALRKIVKVGWGGEPTLTMSTYSVAGKWDGKPVYQTPSWAGH